MEMGSYIIIKYIYNKLYIFEDAVPFLSYGIYNLIQSGNLQVNPV